MPGYISHKGFFADDGERVTIVEFEHEEACTPGAPIPSNIAAQKACPARSTTPNNYVQVCTLDRESKFKAKESAQAEA